ncbi:unnamed protein product [Cylicocyclus nassatus]|uniref:ABC transporter domain-containing protein n=1 Tax=Cylicocyclus nassatus TaxID=53992 RepID=A0AA36MC66_CYLNA|nr:unnamed protein product [Cylicocyclus nassatus]
MGMKYGESIGATENWMWMYDLDDAIKADLAGSIHRSHGPPHSPAFLELFIRSGKNLLLDAIARTASGDITGTVQLNKYTITRSRFLKYCSYVPARREYPGFMTLNSLLYYTAALTFGNFRANDIKTRLHYLMRTFDLLGYGHEKLGDLSKTARRRVAVAIALVKDPVLLILENPLRGLEPIACYQLINCLRSYAIEQNRIVLITINEPRTDICQSISRITVLFQGRVMYSGEQIRVIEHSMIINVT